MFERFTKAAREVVVGAQERARRLHHDQIGAEHLLLSILDIRGSVAADVLTDLGLSRERLIERMSRFGVADGNALREIGVDLDDVRRRAEANFGPGALDAPRVPRAGWLGRFGPGRHLRFADAAKQALAQSLRQPAAQRANYIGVDHLLLGLLADDHGPAALTLRDLGVDVETVRTRVTAALRRAA